jgi:Na+-driven multidrug efflux pump
MTAEAFQADLHRPALSLPKTYSGEARASLALATPIAATQLLWMAVGVADVMMVARLGADALAAIALATAAYYMLFWPSMGFVNAVSPVSAQAIGADPNGLNRLLRSEETNARLRIALRMGIWMGVAVSIPVIASGGAGTMAHFLDAFKKGRADAALAASLFHRKELRISTLKHYLKTKGIPVRGH